MKNILLTLSLVLFFVTYTPTANAASVAQTLCEYVSVDDKSRFRSFLKTNKLKIRKIFDDIKCNGKNMVAFASVKNSVQVGTLMIGKLPKSKVETVLATIQSPALLTAAQKRISS
jgi:hypothetical protein